MSKLAVSILSVCSLGNFKGAGSFKNISILLTVEMLRKCELLVTLLVLVAWFSSAQAVNEVTVLRTVRSFSFWEVALEKLQF